MPRQHIVVTGARGRIGSALVNALLATNRSVTAVDVTDPDPGSAGTPSLRQVAASITDPTTMRELTEGADGVVHLGGISSESDWGSLAEVNVAGTLNVLEACRSAGVASIVLASSAHAAGYARPLNSGLESMASRPDSLYGVSKLAVEALASLFADRHAMIITSLRIGTCSPRPTDLRSLSTWLSFGDMYRIVDVALSRRDVGAEIWWAASANTRGWFPLDDPRRYGYDPVDDAEAWADEMERRGDDPVTLERVGGAWARPEGHGTAA